MTKEYRLLRKRLNEITSEFSSLIQTHKRKNCIIYQDLVKSYILLSHAEFENYLEEECKIIIAKSKDKFDNKKLVTKSLLALSTMSNKIFPENDRNHETMQERIDKFYSNYFSAIDSNNGIKRKDLKGLLPNIGIDLNELDETLLSQLDAFGSARGLVAHKTSKTIRDFINEKQTIYSLLESLIELDKKFEELK